MKALIAVVALLCASGASAQIDPALRKDWLARWEKNILSDSRNRYCDKEMGEEIGWLVSPFLDGFYNGYLATRDTQWIDREIDWADAWIKRGVKEPDGFLGWPKDGSGGNLEDQFTSDSLLGEAMGFRPVVLMAGEILRDPKLKKAYGAKASGYLALAESTFRKWDARGCWREVKGGGAWVVPSFGMDSTGAKFTEGYARRSTDGFSNPANKENLIAEWMIAMYDVTKKPVYRDRAEKWWRLMKRRLRAGADGRFLVWNYWDPVGPWDFKPDGSTKHWVGVHPNGGYYGIDVSSMVVAYEHGLVFDRADVDRLVATNVDFMWNHQVAGARFRRIDGGEPDPRWKDSPGLLWTSLLPYSATLRKVFEANHDPAGWGGLAVTPWYLQRMTKPAK